MKQSGLTLKSLAIVLAAGLLLPASTVNGEPMQATPMQATKEGFAETDDGVRIHYRLLGPTDAPTLWVGYPWTEGWDRIMQELGSPGRGTDVNRELIETLTATYQVLHVDYPRGTGRSTGPLPGDLKPETVAKDYVAVADAAGSRSVRCHGILLGRGLRPACRESNQALCGPCHWRLARSGRPVQGNPCNPRARNRAPCRPGRRHRR